MIINYIMVKKLDVPTSGAGQGDARSRFETTLRKVVPRNDLANQHGLIRSPKCDKKRIQPDSLMILVAILAVEIR